MKKIGLLLLLLFFVLLGYKGIVQQVDASGSTVTPTPTTTTLPPGVAIPTPADPSTVVVGDWVPDDTVTFLGKAASRSGAFVSSILANYQWGYQDTALQDAWIFIRNIVFVLLILIILGAAFTMIISGGANVTVLIIMRKFIIMLLFISFSFALIRLLYQITDILQSFFLHGPSGALISAKDLLSMGFGYNFAGFRKVGSSYNESAFISLLLVQLTAITFYVMGSLLMIRKIILWFFLIVSPLYPLILLYFPIRNTAKVWISEFFRWLLYAPIFALFLLGVVYIWRANINIVPFHFQSLVTYPTGVSILLGGPGQLLGLANSVNSSDTFLQYVVALLMLWVAMILPFMLLQILLDYLGKTQLLNGLPQSLTNIQQTLLKGNIPGFGKTPPIPPSNIGSTGVARAIQNETIAKGQQVQQRIEQLLNESKDKQTVVPSFSQASQTNKIGAAWNAAVEKAEQQVAHTTQNIGTQTQHIMKTIQSVVHLKPEIAQNQSLRLINFSIPTMQDIVQFETAHLAKISTQPRQVTQIQETLTKLANPQLLTTLAEKQKYQGLKEKLSQETVKGDPLAKSLLTAVKTVEAPAAKQPIELPAINHIQTVSIDDYEQVKELWTDSYTNVDVPPSDPQQSRQQWVAADVDSLVQTMDLLTSANTLKVQEGLERVSAILPFILIGGFSQTEVIAYLKAKLQAGKDVLRTIESKKQEEETFVNVTVAKKEKPKELSASAEAVEEDPPH